MKNGDSDTQHSYFLKSDSQLFEEFQMLTICMKNEDSDTHNFQSNSQLFGEFQILII